MSNIEVATERLMVRETMVTVVVTGLVFMVLAACVYVLVR